MRHDNFIPQPQLVRFHSRGRLPHREVDHAVYFITFRLNDSLPREVAEALILDRQRMLRGITTATERLKLDASFSIQLDQYLDRNHGSCLLRHHAEIVADARKYFDGNRYELHAWCVMPNHVHVMLYVERGDQGVL